MKKSQLWEITWFFSLIWTIIIGLVGSIWPTQFQLLGLSLSILGMMFTVFALMKWMITLSEEIWED